jgi:hypothetical protein
MINLFGVLGGGGLALKYFNSSLKIETLLEILFVVFIIICSFFFKNRKIRNNKKLFKITLTIPISSVTFERKFQYNDKNKNLVKDIVGLR